MAESLRIEVHIQAKDGTGPGVSSATKKLTGFERAVQKTWEQLKKLGGAKCTPTVDMKDRMSERLERIGSTLRSVAGKAWSITLKVLDMATAPIRKIFQLLRNPIVQLGATIGISAGFKDTIDTFANFEASMSNVAAISGATGAEMQALTTKAKELGSTTKFTATEASEALSYMAMAGWKTEDMLSGIEGVMNLAAASGEDLASVSDIVTDAMTAFGLSAKDSAMFADVLAMASNASNTDVAMLGESFKYVGSIAGAFKYSIQDVALALGLMANNGIKGSQAGTALRGLLSNMSGDNKKAQETMNALGVSIVDASGNTRPFVDVLTQLRSGFSGLTDAQKAQYASALAGQEGMSGLLAIVNSSEQDFNALKTAIDGAEGSSARMAATMQDNLKGAFTKLSSATEGVKITLGERLKPYLMDLATWLTNSMPAIESAIGKTMDKVDAMVAKLKLSIQSLTKNPKWTGGDLFDKIEIAWDKIIAEPFGKWWDGSGQAWFSTKINQIGTFITKALNKVLTQTIPNMFKNAIKLLPGGQEADISSLFSAASIFAVGKKLGVGSLIKKGLSSLMPLLKSAVGGTGVGSLLSGFFGWNKSDGTGDDGSGAPGSAVSTMNVTAGVVNIEALRRMPKTGTPAAPTTSGAGGTKGLIASLGGMGTLVSVASAVAAGVTVASAAKDLGKAATTYSDYERTDSLWSAGSKLGMVGIGAAIGSIIPGIGTLVGAGVGGLASLLGGDAITETVRQIFDSNYRDMLSSIDIGQKVTEAVDTYTKVKEQADQVRALADEYRELQAAISGGTLVGADLDAAQGRIQEIVAALAEVYPGIISGYDATSGKLDEHITKLEEILALEEQRAMIALRSEITSANQNLPMQAEQIAGKRSYIEEKQGALVQADTRATGIAGFLSQIQPLNQALADGKIEMGDYSSKVEAVKQSVISWANENGFDDIAQSMSGLMGLEIGEYLFGQSEHAQSAIEALTTDLGKATEEYEKLVASVQSQYDSEIKLLEMDSGVDIEDAISKLNTLEQAKQQVQDYGAITTETFNNLKTLMPEVAQEMETCAQAQESLANGNITYAQLEELKGILPETAENMQLLSQAQQELSQNGELSAATIAKLAAVIPDFSTNLESLANAQQELSNTGTLSRETIEALSTTLPNAAEHADLFTKALSEIDTKGAVSADTLAKLSKVMQEAGESTAMTEANVQYLADKLGIAKEQLEPVLRELGLINDKYSEIPEVKTIDVEVDQTGTETLGEVESAINSLPEEVRTQMTMDVANALSDAETLEETLASLDPEVRVAVEMALTEALTQTDALQLALSGLPEEKRTEVTAQVSQAIADGQSFSEIIDLIPSEKRVEFATNMANVLTDCGSFSSILSGIPESKQLTIVENFTDCTGKANGFWTALQQIPNSQSVTILHNMGDAAGAAGTLKDQIDGIPSSKTVTITVNTVGASSFNFGVPEANGDIVTRPQFSLIGEAGPEAIIPLSANRRERGLELWQRAGEALGVMKDVTYYAGGGVVTSPHMGVVGEAGAEAIIPLSPGKRNRGMDLWQQAGQMLGVAAYADGGIAGDVATQTTAPVPVQTPSYGGASVTVEVSASPTITIKGSDGMGAEDIAAVVQGRIRDMADDIGGEIANRLIPVFSNMPMQVQ